MDLPEDPLAPLAPRQFVTLRDRLVYLRSLPEMVDLPVDSLATFAQALEEHRVPRNTVLVGAGEPLTHAYFLVEGVIGLYVDDERITEILPPNEVAAMGVLAELSGPPGNIAAETDCLLLRIDARSLRSLQENDTRILFGTLRSVSQIVLKARGSLPFDPNNPPEADPGEPPERRLDFVDKLLWLHQTGVFAASSLDALGELARHYEEVHYEAGEAIWRRGDRSPFVLLVLSGLIECSSADGSGLIGSEYTLGFFDGVGRLPRAYDAIAQTKVVALRLEVRAFLDVLEDQFDLALSALQTLAGLAVNHQWRTQFALTERAEFEMRS